MATGGTALERDPRRQQIERLIASPLLHNSESLCNLLRFLARQALEHPGKALKEYQIATELFGRPADFDPRLDSSVRVQTGRLRSKLAEYYAGPGAADHLVVEIPKGSYSLTFREREAESAPSPLRARRAGTRRWPLLLAAFAGAALLYALAPRLVRSAPRPTQGMQLFWQPFLTGPEEPLVVYSNAVFAGRPETGMHYQTGPADGAPLMDHYTGVGEVMAVHALDQVFSRFQRNLRIKRGRLLSWDDAKTCNLIFVGSTAENLPLRDLPGTREFVFRVRDNEPRKGDLAIVNMHPRAGEPGYWLSSPGLPVQEDYAVLGLLPGLNPSRRILVLAGTTTFGTQAAAEYVAEPANLEDLLGRLSGARPFEAVLRVRISGGVPVRSEVVALRK